ncbi:MAG: type I 3-dehydroquinate dehydratase [Lachnospiraceae bacterium]|nr:type I 3-dehydroquinate dehydratase [Lachnospiraceae bacterium]
MGSINVRNITIGQGMPKICVPIVAADDDELVSVLGQAVEASPDIIEFRGDYYKQYRDEEKLINALHIIRDSIGDTVLLFTLRTSNEGGDADISAGEYFRLIESVCESGLIDMVDVEAFMQEGMLNSICDVAHENHVYVVASSHDFERTPEEKVIFDRLKYMDDNGADIPKVAVMPETEEDVLTLLSATLKYKRLEGSKPVITMSMGRTGLISRLSVELFGSAVTFAAAGRSSAPGQIDIKDVRYILELLHNSGRN